MEFLESEAEKIFKESVAASVVALALVAPEGRKLAGFSPEALPSSHAWRCAVEKVRVAEVLMERGQISVLSPFMTVNAPFVARTVSSR